MGCSRSCSKREVYSNIGLSQERRKISNKQPNLPSKGILKRRTSKAQSQQKEGNNNDQKGNKIETKKKTIENINENKCRFLK